MGRQRRCDWRCHTAKGSRCECWCGGHFHGSAGAINRDALHKGVENIQDHGFKTGETAYMEPTNFLSEVADGKNS